MSFINFIPKNSYIPTDKPIAKLIKRSHWFASLTDGARFGGSCLIHGPSLPRLPLHADCEDLQVGPADATAAAAAALDGSKSPVLRPSSTFSHSKCPPEIHRSCLCVRFIAEHTKMLEDSTKVCIFPRIRQRVFYWLFYWLIGHSLS